MKKIWDRGEIIAIEYLQKQNYSIKNTNFKFWRFWEIDIICKKDSHYHFIEVKYRSDISMGYPEEAIIPQKLHKCLKTMQYYCKANWILFEKIQFDVITVLKQEKFHRITHYKNVEI